MTGTGLILKAAAVALVSAILASPAFAQGAGAANASQSGIVSGEAGVSDLVTASVGENFASVASECGALDAIYRLDCLRQGIDLSAKSTPYHGDYSAARQVLNDTATALRRTTDAHIDRSAPRYQVKPNTNARFPSRRYYSAVPLSDAGVVDQARKALDDAAKGLDQAASGKDGLASHYAKIAEALKPLGNLLQN